MSITATAYFEICDSVLYGGEGSKIYTKLDVDCEIEDVNKDFEEIIEDFRKNLADSCSVDEKKVRLVKRTEALECMRTKKDNRGNWEVCGFSWDNLREGHVITKEENMKLYGCLWKLKEYESTGLSPDQVGRIHEQETKGWIDAEYEVPSNDEYILLSFSNWSLPSIGRYQEDENGGTFYNGDDDEPCTKYGLFVNAWMPLPERYDPEVD